MSSSILKPKYYIANFIFIVAAFFVLNLQAGAAQSRSLHSYYDPIELRIQALYIAFYNRASDKGGLDFWYGRISSGASDLEDISAGFAAHPKFREEYGDMNDEAFVTAIYINMLGSAPDAGGLAYWKGELGKGVSRSAFIASFINSTFDTDLDRMLADGDITQQEYDDAVTRRDMLINKSEVAVEFVNYLGDGSNVTDEDDLNNDPAYQASIKILSNVTYAESTKVCAITFLEDHANGNGVQGVENINGTDIVCTVPIAEAGVNQGVITDSLVILDGSASTDADGDSLSYAWSFLYIPPGSSAALSGTSTVNPTFTADEDGYYVAQLIVNDGNENSIPDAVVITASTGNLAPVSNAGADQNVLTSSLVMLDGSASSDINGDVLTYSWTLIGKPAGSSAVLSGATTIHPSFTADADGSYVLQLVVSDGVLDSTPDTMIVISINSNSMPVADAGSNQNADIGSTITLDGSGSTDTDGDILTYSWTMISKPAGSSAVLSGATTVNPTFTADVEGSYVAQLIASDALAGSVPDVVVVQIDKVDEAVDPKYELEYKGLVFYHQNKASSDYGLDQLTNGEFNAMSDRQKLQIANNLLSSLFFGYPQNELQAKIDSGNFITEIRSGMEEERTDKAWLESYILDDDIFTQFSRWHEPQAITILTRFYAMDELDSYFLKNWIAYILTQTILFSPAYELVSTHTPNISGVYNRIVTFLNEESGMRYITYVHMMSEDNWRRFRSPEDNGREMLEIYHLDMEDDHVPIAAKALQNWKLNTDSDTLEVGLNQNTEPLNLFGTTIYNGDDFYRELVKADQFATGVTARLVDFFFPEASSAEKQQIVNTIVSSGPETWQDILLQIIFSEEYLLHNQRARSAEEVSFSLAKKMDFKHKNSTFYYLKESLENMHQASMKYKLGKLERVPQDTLSFAHYHKFIRENVLLRWSNPDKIDDYGSWSRQGWSDSFISFENFDYDSSSDTISLDALVNYIFKTVIAREATAEELQLFRDHTIESRDGKQLFRYEFNMFKTYDDPDTQAEKREEYKRNIAFIVLDYISRLDVTYTQREVQ